MSVLLSDFAKCRLLNCHSWSDTVSFIYSVPPPPVSATGMQCHSRLMMLTDVCGGGAYTGVGGRVLGHTPQQPATFTSEY